MTTEPSRKKSLLTTFVEEGRVFPSNEQAVYLKYFGHEHYPPNTRMGKGVVKNV